MQRVPQRVPIPLLEDDHVIPQRAGSQDNIENLQLLCAHCTESRATGRRTGSFSFQGLAKPRMAKAWPGVQPMRRIAAAMLVSPPLRSSPKTTLRNAAIT